MKKTSLTPFAKILIALLFVGGIFFGGKLLMNSGIITAGSSVDIPEGVPKSVKAYNVCVVTWGGYAGGQYFNEGFKANEQSRFYKEYGFLVNFTVIDDFAPSRDAFKSGDCDLLWVTVDAFPTEVESLEKVDPVFLFQTDWSRGGDAIVVREGINSVNDLIGKKVTVALGTPSHTFLIWLLKAAGIDQSKVEIVEVPSAIDAATTFKAGAVDAAVVWSPDDQDLVEKVAGSKVLKSTREASHIIADGFLVRRENLEKNRKDLLNLVRGWLTGSAEINNSAAAKQKAAQILEKGLNQPLDFCLNAINNVRLATYGDNLDFFALSDYKGTTGEDLYTQMSFDYAQIGLAPNRVKVWRTVVDFSFIKEVNLTGGIHSSERQKVFDPSGGSSASAFATKRVTVNFDTGSSVLTSEAKATISREFGPIAKAFANSRVRVEGNTDNTGDRSANIRLSEKRAKTVANFLASRYGFPATKFVIVGNGPDKPIEDNATSEGRSANRRTDFELIN